MDKANLKKDIFVAVISNGSIQQKQNWKGTCESAYEFCTSHLDKGAATSGESLARVIKAAPPKRRGRPKKADK